MIQRYNTSLQLISLENLHKCILTGTVARMCDFATEIPIMMHRTQSIDYGVLVEGEIVMILKGGVEQILKKWDTCVQREILHGWWNDSCELTRRFFLFWWVLEDYSWRKGSGSWRLLSEFLEFWASSIRSQLLPSLFLSYNTTFLSKEIQTVAY